jgi:DNA gyrase subunit A
MIITKNGITIRLKVNTLRVMGRATQGVRLINISESDEIAAVTKVDRFEDEIENDSTIETENTDNLNSENNSQENNSDTTTNETNE